MKTLLFSISLVIALVSCSVGVQPAYVGPSYARPVFVRPAYAIPGPGYVWRQHPVYGWGWFHPGLGWHRGWR